MRFTIILIFGLLLCCCSESAREQSVSVQSESVNADSSEVYSDTYSQEAVDTLSKTEEKEVSVADNPILIDSSNVYVNRVHFFKETHEFYVPLYFNERHSYDDLPAIRAKLDSVIFSDLDYSRRRLPLEVGRKYFDLHLLEQIRIYDYRHALIRSSSLKRVEYLDGPIDSEFIAVFDGADAKEGYQFYGIGGSVSVDYTFRSRKIREKQSVIEKARKAYNLKPSREFTSSSVELASLNSQLIAFCDLTYLGTEVTHLLEVKGDSMRRLIRMEEEYIIWELIATSLMYNKKPVLLLWLAIPETDVMWHVPAVYDGDQYQITRNKFYLDEVEPKKEPVALAINSDSVQVFEALKAHPYPFDTLLSEGYYLKHQVFQDPEYQDFVQSLALMRGDRKVKEFDAYSFGLPYKNIGFIGADFGPSFVFSHAFGSGNPVHIELVEKETGKELLQGFWVDAEEKEQVLLYLESGENLMLFDLRNGVKVHVTDFDQSTCVQQVIGGLRNCVQIDSVTTDTVTLKSEYEEELILKKYSRK